LLRSHVVGPTVGVRVKELTVTEEEADVDNLAPRTVRSLTHATTCLAVNPSFLDAFKVEP